MTAALPDLERSLWTPATRYDRARMEALFAPDFFDFGRSGRRYTRDEVLFDTPPPGGLAARLHDLRVMALTPDIALVTYLSEVASPEGPLWANRSSLWDHGSGRWQLRFHQGTPTGARPFQKDPP